MRKFLWYFPGVLEMGGEGAVTRAINEIRVIGGLEPHPPTKILGLYGQPTIFLVEYLFPEIKKQNIPIIAPALENLIAEYSKIYMRARYGVEEALKMLNGNGNTNEVISFTNSDITDMYMEYTGLAPYFDITHTFQFEKYYPDELRVDIRAELLYDLLCDIGDENPSDIVVIGRALDMEDFRLARQWARQRSQYQDTGLIGILFDPKNSVHDINYDYKITHPIQIPRLSLIDK